jgi:large subunit ribosomal protein L18
MTTRIESRRKRHLRLRRKVSGTSQRPRLSVARTGRHIYAQIVDDVAGKTLAFLTTNRKSFAGDNGAKKNFSNRASARRLGQELAQAAAERGVEKVVFDRGGFKYHGVVKELAEAAREAGLDF